MRAARFRTRVRLGDPLLFFLVVGLSCLGIAKVYSAGVLDVPSTVVAGLWRLQLLWFSLALLLIPLVLMVPIQIIRLAAVPLYVVAMILLILTPIIGTGVGTAEGVPRWIAFGPIRVQTAEFAKIPVILMLSHVLGKLKEPNTSLWQLWKPVAIVSLPMALVMLQPDIGTTIVFGFILLASLYWALVPLRTILMLISPAIALIAAFNVWVWGVWFLFIAMMIFFWKPTIAQGATVLVANVVAGTIALPLWDSLATYQKNRILVFMDPQIDPRGAGYNLIQSRVAIGSGGLTGKGFLEGTQKRLGFLPEQHTDFIFSVLGEEWGFIGVAAVILVFAVILWRLVSIADRTEDEFARLIPFGIAAAWFVHVVVNTGMTVGIMPITGIPLPFISYGGSFLLINLLGMALVQRIASEIPRSPRTSVGE
ncbi:rod shape-determining protein RodA [soil metagenome]